MEAQIEEAIKFRKKANFKILTRLSQIIDQYPYLRFHQILMIYKISELGVDKFNEESVETLKKLEHEMVEKGISKITSNSSDGNNTTDKLKDKAAREAAKDKARLTELLAKKQSEKMESMSEDEIRQRLAELG